MAEPYNAGDEVKVKVRKQKDELVREEQLEALKVVMSTVAGRAFYWRLLGQCGVFRTSFTGNSTTFFNEGKRDIGLWLTSELMAEPSLQEAYLLMQREAIRKENPNG